MEFRYLARLSTSLFFLAVLTGVGQAQAFGRFGYGGPIDVPGMLVDQSGFAAKPAGSSRFAFAAPAKLWHPSSVSDVEEVVDLGDQPGCPSKLDCNLYSPGFRIYCPSGISLTVDCAQNPFISWSDGSVGDGVPTPSLKWAIVSFQENQPPVLLVFEADQGVSLSLKGKSGAWQLFTDKPYVGWVKVCLPNGAKGFQTDSAATLGVLTQRFLKESSFWLAPPAHLLDRKVDSDLLSVTCTWKFDRPNVILPAPATFAQLGGYPISVPTRTRQIQAVDEDGPLVVTDQEELTIRFPIRRIPTGRFLAEGRPESSPPATVSPIDIPSVVDLGMENLTGTCDEATRKLGEQTLAAYFDQANYFAEPITGQQMPFDSKGYGLDLAAAHAFLMQALTTTRQATSEANSLLTSLMWRSDWLTWRIWVPNDEIGRRAEALAALAGALCPEPERRLQAAMMQAGLASERGLNIYARRMGYIKAEPPLLEPMEGLRQVLFALDSKVTGNECLFARAMLSDFRVFGATPIFVDRKNDDLSMVWDSSGLKAAAFTLASAFPISLSPGPNVERLTVKDSLGFTRVQYSAKTPGVCAAKLTLPTYAKPPPIVDDVPVYSEAAR